MAVQVRLPRELRRLYEVDHPAEVDGATVGDVFAALDAAHPGVGHRLMDAGALRRHIIVFVGQERGGLDTPVQDGEEITVVAAVAGGA